MLPAFAENWGSTVFEYAMEKALNNTHVRSFVEEEAEEWVMGMLRIAAGMPMVKIDREAFLRKALKNVTRAEVIETAIALSPQEAGIPASVIDKLANKAINRESQQVAGLSFAAGLPGGFGLIAAVPADIVQYFAHMMRLEQKLAYLYGWPSMLASDGGVSDDTLDKLIMLMGVMMGVEGAEGAVRFATIEMAKQGMVKYARRRAVLQSADQPIIGRVIRFIAQKLGEEGAKKTIGKLVPVIGGVISGSMSYMSFKPAAKKLQAHLRSLPTPVLSAEALS